MILRRMQEMLARLYDAPVGHDVEDYVIVDKRRFTQLTGESCEADEQVALIEDRDGVRVGVYVDEQVLERLERRDPMQHLDDGNLADYCTALEGVSHFHYLMWSLGRARDVSLLELELQADVDKYAGAVKLLTQQGEGRFPLSLHRRLFHGVRFLPGLSEEHRRRYEEANRSAARFCRGLEEKFMRPRHSRPEAWILELRRFFRCSHQEKLRLVSR
ncbi:MAG TPA: hypothetical protein PKE27_19465 [Povalibacter sp.]|uniref:hypothetical protein n=1 Tax=Povalibacter sp. TaxID=1962978 RepID=UPI002B603C8F|nr:hypothetical protein [Povalibacter sp.]HMN46765.1 hypothetical protein [Povalibacter sp.]